MGQKKEKKFLFLKIITFVLETSNSHNLEQDTCHWQSMCGANYLRFNISLREIFSESGSLRVMRKYDESAVMQIFQEFGTL